MKANKQTYQLLKTEDFKKISSTTNYVESYIRKLLRGFVEIIPRHKIIFDEADKMLATKNRDPLS